MSRPKDKILAALEEIRDLVEKNCGETKETVREAVAETIATLNPQIMPNKPATFANAIVNQQPAFVPNTEAKPKTTDAVCPGGPATWNQFQKWYKETHADELKGVPYREVQKIVSSAYKQTACGPSIEEKLKTRRAVKTIKPPVTGNTTQPTVKKTRGRKPKTLAPVIQTVPNQPKAFTMGENYSPEYRTLITHQQNAEKTLKTIQENYPELAGNINSAQRLINSQDRMLQNLNTTYQKNKGKELSPFSNKTHRTVYNRTLQTVKNTKQKIDDALQTLRTRANNVKTRRVRIQAPNNSQARTPGRSGTLTSSASTLRSNNSGNKTLQLNNSTLKQITPPTNNKPKLEFNGPVEENGTRKARINGKKYFYWENDEGKHLLERMNNNSPGDEAGFYNENAPGYYRPA